MPIANTTIRLRKSATPGNQPSSLANGEIAINYADGRIYYLNANGSIASISGGGSSSYSFSTINVNSSLVLATSPTDILTLAGANGITVTACTSTKTITIGNDNTAALAYAKANAATLTVSNWYTGNVISGTISDVKFLNFNANSGISVSNTGNNSALITLGSSFKTWQVNGQTSLVAVGEDTVNFNAGNNIVITTNQSANPQQITFGTSANLTARYFIGDGSLLTGITSGGGGTSGNSFGVIYTANNNQYAKSATANAQINFTGVAGVSVFANAITNTVTFAGSPGAQGLTVDYGFVYQTLDYIVDYGSI